MYATLNNILKIEIRKLICQNCSDSYIESVLYAKCYNLSLKEIHEAVQNERLAIDIATKKMEIPEKIEAGLATEQEIEDYMQEDFDFINKYY
jgi:hypothetical protein